MSGGAYDYAYHKVHETAEEVRRRHPDETLLIAFAALLDRVGAAMKALEYEDSGDGGDWEALVKDLVGADENELEYVYIAWLTIRQLPTSPTNQRIVESLAGLLARRGWGLPPATVVDA